MVLDFLILGMSILIAIGGVSRSGKSTLAMWLSGQLEQSIVLHQDDYVLPQDHLPKINGLPNWEVPQAINWDLWTAAIAKALTQFDHVIIEGILVFANTNINKLINQSFYLTIEKKDFIYRRLKEERWGDEPIWLLEYIWSAHLKHGIPPVTLEAKTLHKPTEEDSRILFTKVLR